jgi:hypothetical protein
MIIGTLVVIFFVFIDYLGIGDPGFGYRQIIGIALGILIVLVGVSLKRKKSV